MKLRSSFSLTATRDRLNRNQLCNVAQLKDGMKKDTLPPLQVALGPSVGLSVSHKRAKLMASVGELFETVRDFTRFVFFVMYF